MGAISGCKDFVADKDTCRIIELLELVEDLLESVKLRLAPLGGGLLIFAVRKPFTRVVHFA